MKNKKWILIGILLLVLIVYSTISIMTNMFYNNDNLNYLMLFITFVIGIITLYSVINLIKNGYTGKDKIFNSLVENSDTIYIVMDKKSKNVKYISNNVEDILGMKKEEKSNEDIVNHILSIPVIRSEINHWDKNSSYVSSMVEYDNPRYNYRMWIRIKIFPYKDKIDDYYLLQIMDATKEHDRQHLLISQASNIKSRESILNQITEKSYDFEININLTLNSYELNYFKKDKLYFGEEKRGKYSEDLNNILNYINESDRKLVSDYLNINSLKEHFDKYELDSISFRYRIGNEVKNNIWLESTIFFINDKQKNIVSILTKNVTEDAESIRRQNIMLQNALNESRLASKSKTELISTISHDVRIPLTNIIGLSESLIDSELDKSVKEDIKNINDSSNEMLEIIDGLLDTSNIEKKLIEKNEKNYSILKMFKKIEMSAKEYIGNKQIKLNINLDNNLPVILYGDYIRITRAINEIVNNSIKHTSEGLIDITVKGEKVENNVNLIVEVKDTGEGIEQEKLNLIMSSDSGNGINSVKNLVKLLDGKFEIESKVGEYTKVTLSFNQKIVEDNKVRELMKSNKEAEEFSLAGKKVLVVDDNELNLKVANRLLSSYNLDITLIQSGEECIEYVKNNSFDLILMDQMMPGIDGIETLKRLKEIEGFNTPIVVLTADAMSGQKEKYLNSGFADYLSKPIDKSELSRVLKKFLKND